MIEVAVLNGNGSRLLRFFHFEKDWYFFMSLTLNIGGKPFSRIIWMMRTKSSNWLQVIVIIIWDSNLSILKFMLHQKQEYHCAQFFGDTCKDFKESYPTFLGPHLWQAHMQRPRRWTRNVSDSLLLLAALLSLWLWHRRVLYYLLIFITPFMQGWVQFLVVVYWQRHIPVLRYRIFVLLVYMQQDISVCAYCSWDMLPSLFHPPTFWEMI